MGIIAKVAIKAAEEAAERSAASSAKGAARKAEAGVADAAHAANKAHPNGNPSEPRGTKGEVIGSATGISDAKVTQSHTEQPNAAYREKKSVPSPFGLGGGSLLTLAIVVALFIAAFRKLRKLSRTTSDTERR
jgi:hypothetical protein